MPGRGATPGSHLAATAVALIKPQLQTQETKDATRLRETALVERRGAGGVVMATVNVVGGLLVTDRMLQMFRKKPDEI